MEKITAPKGTKDLFSPEIELWQFVEETIRDLFGRFFFTEIRTPIFEHTELFVRGIGGETEVVSKEMYTFPDKKNRSITLRPENTASVVRAAIEHNFNDIHFPQRYYYLGPMFRYEKPQKGRQRQFHQFGIEIFNDNSPEVDAEVVYLADRLLTELGISETKVEINSVGCLVCRPPYLKQLSETLSKSRESLCSDCQRKSEHNPLRVFDCKKPGCSALANDLPKITQHLCEECDSHFSGVKNALEVLGTKYEINDKLVRGLDYYTKTAFEITSGSLGAQNAILGGGRYNNLFAELGGRDTPGIGFAAGIERIILHLSELKIEKKKRVQIVYQSSDIRDEALKLLSTCWQSGLHAFMDYGASNMKKQFKKGDKLSVDYSFIIGSEEVERSELSIKDMKSREQIKIKTGELEQWIKKHI